MLPLLSISLSLSIADLSFSSFFILPQIGSSTRPKKGKEDKFEKKISNDEILSLLLKEIKRSDEEELENFKKF
jgi:hypothetical protein